LVPITSKDIKSLRESIDQLTERLEERMQKLKSLYVEDQSSSDPNQSFQMPRVFRAGSQSIEAFVGWSEEIFRILIGRAYSLLYQPLMRDPTLWPEFRDELVSSTELQALRLSLTILGQSQGSKLLCEHLSRCAAPLSTVHSNGYTQVHGNRFSQQQPS